MERVAEVFGVFAAPSVVGFSPVVVLRADDGRLLPIYIGIAEAIAIHSALRGQVPPRPMTHDLISEIIRKAGLRVERVIIDDLVDNTFYARIIIKKNDEGALEIDARPSDSIALALRLSCPIFVDNSVLDEAANEELPENYVEFDEIA